MSPKRGTAVALLVVGFAALLADLAIGQTLIAPARHAVGPAPADLQADSVRIDSAQLWRLGAL